MTTYSSIHTKLRIKRGHAWTYRCCGCGLSASHWAYDHEDLDEATDAKGRTYSVNLSHYLPLCGQCHFRFDAPHSNDVRRRSGLRCPGYPFLLNVELSKRLGSWPPPPRPVWPPPPVIPQTSSDDH